MTRNEIIRMAREAGSIDHDDVIETIYAAFSDAIRKQAESEEQDELVAAYSRYEAARYKLAKEVERVLGKRVEK